MKKSFKNPCAILDINKDEILGGSIEETKNKRKWLNVCVIITAVSILIAAFFGLGGMEYIERRSQSGVAFLTVFLNDELMQTTAYTVSSGLKSTDMENGYGFDADYGEMRGTVYLTEQYEIEFGFINTNNWHNVQIRLDVENGDGQLSVIQTISYKTDDDIFDVIVTEAETSENKVSVFREGV